MKRLLSTLLLGGLMFAPIGLAACGGSSGASNTGSSGGGSTAPASSATVSTKKEPGYGTVLVNSSGQALYLLSNDPAGGSKAEPGSTVTIVVGQKKGGPSPSPSPTKAPDQPSRR